jgi:DNA invertase Pin-like site-specific DNA recombinase
MAGLARHTAPAGVHRRDELEARGIGNVVIGARDHTLPALQRLAERIEDGGRELGKLVEEEDAAMGKRNFARPHAQPPADHRGHRSRVMRGAKRPAIGEPPARQLPRDGGDGRHLQELCGRQRRQDRGQARGEHRLARPRRARHQHIMPLTTESGMVVQMPIKAYSYIRFSTPEQRLGDSLRRQIAQARAYAETHNLEFDDTFRDEGRSAFRGSNRDEKAALGAFLSAVERGTITPGSYLLIESLDRLSREQVATALRLFLSILEHGVVVVTIADNRTYSNESVSIDPLQLIISIAVMMRAHDESRVKSQRVGAAWENKRTLARTEKRAMTAICPGWLRKVGTHYVEDPHRADVVRRIFDLSIAGSGARAIAKVLNEDTEPVFGRGRFWHDSYIKKILDNHATYGRFLPAATSALTEAETPIDGYFPAVIDEQTFYQSLAARRGRTASTVRSPSGKVRNLLSGLGKCGSCNGGMHYVDKGQRKGGRPYLQCGSSRLSGGCSNRMRYRYHAVELALMSVAHNAFTTSPPSDISNPILPLEIKRDDVKARLDRLLDIAESGDSSVKILHQRIVFLEQSLAAAELELRRARESVRIAAASTPQDSFKRIGELYNEFQNNSEDIALRRRVATAVRTSLVSFTFNSNGFAYAEFRNGCKTGTIKLSQD